jgi:hypothetical protein
MQQMSRLDKHFLIIFLLVLTSLVAPHLYSQDNLSAPDSTVAFSNVSIEICAVFDVNRNSFHHNWDPKFGGEVIFAAPFYFGHIQTGIHMYLYEGKNEQFPDLLSSYIFLGWGIQLEMSSWLNWYNGLRVGVYVMDFDDEDINRTQQRESELGLGLSSEFTIRITQKWRARIGLGYMNIYTNPHLELTMISLGVTYTFDSPNWLQDFLK